jgi:hypothetical protein
MHPAKGRQTENVRAQIKCGKGALQQKGVKQGSSVYTNCSPTFFSLIMAAFARQSRRIIDNNNSQTDNNVSRRVTVSEQHMSTACTNMATMRTFKSYIGQIYNITRI